MPRHRKDEPPQPPEESKPRPEDRHFQPVTHIEQVEDEEATSEPDETDHIAQRP